VVKLAVKVVPGATRAGIAGWLGDELKLRVSAPPEQGKANAAVCALLAKALQLPADAVRVHSGHGNPHKVLEISGIDAAELAMRIARALAVS